ncbi:MAG: hypothetical protein LBM38_03325 [Clostridiales bacterium]|jgi:2-phosphoglycerate kinase|nr:hypothetical protein [Clostridiales bacterium]
MKLVLISGASGVGKTIIAEKICESHKTFARAIDMDIMTRNSVIFDKAQLKNLDGSIQDTTSTNFITESQKMKGMLKNVINRYIEEFAPQDIVIMGNNIMPNAFYANDFPDVQLHKIVLTCDDLDTHFNRWRENNPKALHKHFVMQREIQDYLVSHAKVGNASIIESDKRAERKIMQIINKKKSLFRHR